MTEMAAFLQVEQWPPTLDWLFWVCAALVVGALLGELVFGLLGWPRIVGYSAAGMAVALAGSGLGEGRLQGNVRLVVDLALALLLFELGSRVSLRWLRANPALLWTSAAESAASFGAVFALLRWVGWEANLALAGSALTVSASGAVISRISSELKSAGQVTERMIVLSAFNTLYAVLALRLVIGWLYLDQRGDWVRGISLTFYTLAGSVVLAALLSKALAWLMRRFDLRNENAALLLLGMVLLALTGARSLGLSTLLVPLLAGVMLRNSSERPCIWPRHFGTAGGVLVLMLYVIVGSAWSRAMLATGLGLALALIVVRGVAKVLVLTLTARASGIRVRQGLALGLALTPISATTLVLLADLHASHPEVAERLAPMTFSAIAVMAIAGPIAAQWGLRLAGEYQVAVRSTSAGPT